jgi:hypothetical protein
VVSVSSQSPNLALTTAAQQLYGTPQFGACIDPEKRPIEGRSRFLPPWGTGVHIGSHPGLQTSRRSSRWLEATADIERSCTRCCAGDLRHCDERHRMNSQYRRELVIETLSGLSSNLSYWIVSLRKSIYRPRKAPIGVQQRVWLTVCTSVCGIGPTTTLLRPLHKQQLRSVAIENPALSRPCPPGCPWMSPRHRPRSTYCKSDEAPSS